jgi:hypothetical protein
MILSCLLAISIQWATPLGTARPGHCQPESLARSWSYTVIYVQPRKSPWIPLALFWPFQVPFPVDSTVAQAPGTWVHRDLPERQPGDTYLLVPVNVAGRGCMSRPIAAWR